MPQDFNDIFGTIFPGWAPRNSQPAAPQAQPRGPIPSLARNINAATDNTRRGIYEGVQAMLDEDSRLAGVEDQRFQQQSDFLTQQFNSINNMGADVQAAINRGLVSEAATGAGLMARDAVANLRRSLGARGIGGGSGVATGLLTRIEQDRSASMDTSRRAIARDYAMRAQDRGSQQFAQALGLGQFRSQGGSMLRSDSLRDALNALLGIEGIETQQATAKDAAKAAKSGGLLGGIGGIIGAIL